MAILLALPPNDPDTQDLAEFRAITNPTEWLSRYNVLPFISPILFPPCRQSKEIQTWAAMKILDLISNYDMGAHSVSMLDSSSKKQPRHAEPVEYAAGGQVPSQTKAGGDVAEKGHDGIPGPDFMDLGRSQRFRRRYDRPLLGAILRIFG